MAQTFRRSFYHERVKDNYYYLFILLFIGICVLFSPLALLLGIISLETAPENLTNLGAFARSPFGYLLLIIVSAVFWFGTYFSDSKKYAGKLNKPKRKVVVVVAKKYPRITSYINYKQAAFNKEKNTSFFLEDGSSTYEISAQMYQNIQIGDRVELVVYEDNFVVELSTLNAASTQVAMDSVTMDQASEPSLNAELDVAYRNKNRNLLLKYLIVIAIGPFLLFGSLFVLALIAYLRTV